jgi:hypothetical protein
MSFVPHIAGRAAFAPASPGAGNNAAAPGFMLPPSSASISARGASPAASSPLGSQSTSFLLQTQDVKSAGGHGGGGHHGMKMQAGLEAEEMAENGEMESASPRRKLVKSAAAELAEKAKETAENQENQGGDTDEETPQES